MSNRPVKEFYSEDRKGTRMAVWLSEKGYYSVTMSRSYKDKTTEEWKKSYSFSLEDLEAFSQELPKAIAYLRSAKGDVDTGASGATNEERLINTAKALSRPTQQTFEDDDIPF